MEMELRADWPTPWMVWIRLYSSTHFIFLPSVCKSLIEGMEATRACVCTKYTSECMCASSSWFGSTTVAVFTRTFICIHLRLFIGFQHALLCRLPVLTWAPAHTFGEHMWFWTDVWKQCCYTSTSQDVQCSWTLLCLLKNCSQMNKTHDATSFLLPSFSFLLLCSCPLSLCLGHQPFVNLGKRIGTTSCFLVCMANGLFWMGFWSWMHREAKSYSYRCTQWDLILEKNSTEVKRH